MPIIGLIILGAAAGFFATRLMKTDTDLLDQFGVVVPDPIEDEPVGNFQNHQVPLDLDQMQGLDPGGEMLGIQVGLKLGEGILPKFAHSASRRGDGNGARKKLSTTLPTPVDNNKTPYISNN